MFKSITDRIVYPAWVNYDPRYARLDKLDRALDGTLYDDLKYSYYDEKQMNGEPVKMRDRRPAAQFRLPQMVARSCARKMFSGRHIPRIRNSANPSETLAFEKSLKTWGLWETMLEAAVSGSVGSVAVTFRIDEGRAAFYVWRAKYCNPSFDDMGELICLRVTYVTTGAQLMAFGAESLDPTRMYWFIRDYKPDCEIDYVPPRHDEWDPVRGFVDSNCVLVERQNTSHDFGFVPGVWIVNMRGGEAPDGLCTWRPALDNSIELDYDMSQGGRGVRYNCAPQLVIKGEPAGDSVDEDGNLVRGPADYIQLDADRKSENGEMVSGGDAKLLEMGGSGITAALSYIDRLRALALEQINASRKNPDKINGVISGRGMEYLDEDFNDLIMELRTQYDPTKLVSKVACALGKDDLAAGFTTQWPRLYQPTIQDIAALIPALKLAVGSDEVQDPAIKSGIPGKTPNGKPLLTHEEARAILVSNLDLGLMDVESEDSVPNPKLDVDPQNELITAIQPIPVNIEATA